MNTAAAQYTAVNALTFERFTGKPETNYQAIFGNLDMPSCGLAAPTRNTEAKKPDQTIGLSHL
ncbi:hypothetical protein, partial [Pseudomonas viridiflava]|uniref:hypothetical protein n=1 Tax=Pseudomonas viridiflava TaxID=33069 RepID=UPI0019800B0F